MHEEPSVRCPPRPAPPDFDNIPAEVKALVHWLCWSWGDVPKRVGRVGKVPYGIGDRRADYTNPAAWLPFATVVQQYKRGGYDGIGLVLGEVHPGLFLCGLDEDHVVEWHGENEGRWTEKDAARNVEALNTYTEYSISGTGVHCLALGSLPAGRRRTGNHELYSELRYFVVTGRKLRGSPEGVENREMALRDLHARLFPAKGPEKGTPSPSVTQCPRNGHSDIKSKLINEAEGGHNYLIHRLRRKRGRVLWLAGIPPIAK